MRHLFRLFVIELKQLYYTISFCERILNKGAEAEDVGAASRLSIVILVKSVMMEYYNKLRSAYFTTNIISARLV